TRQASVASAIGARADVVVGGHVGDLWHDRLLSPHSQSLLDETVGLIVKKGSGWLLQHVAQANGISDPRELMRGFVETELARLNHIEDPDFRVKVYKLS